MKRVLFVLVLCLPLAAIAQNQKFNQDGEFASINLSPDPNSSISLQVSRNTSNTGTTANVVFVSVSFAADFSSFSFTEIIGNIPASAFSGQNTQNLTLNLDTSQMDSSAIKITCTFDFATETNNCGAPPDGTINLQFRGNGAQRTRILALGSETILGPLTIRNHQRSDNSSANVQGTIFGNSISSSAATVGINHNSTIEIVHN